MRGLLLYAKQAVYVTRCWACSSTRQTLPGLALGEFGATIMFAGNLEGITQTMPLAIYPGFERSLGVAIAHSIFLILVSVVLLEVMRRLERDSRVDVHYM